MARRGKKQKFICANPMVVVRKCPKCNVRVADSCTVHDCGTKTCLVLE